SQCEESDIDIVVAASRDAIVMVEGGGLEISERELADALEFAHTTAQPVLDLIEELRAVVGKAKSEFTAPKLPDDLAKRVSEPVDDAIMESALITDKHQRYAGYREAKARMLETLPGEIGEERYLEHEKLLKAEFDERKYELVRSYVLTNKKRI